MSVVTLVSGGLDSTLMATLIRDKQLEQFPLFIDYGQLARERELAACQTNLGNLGLPSPTVLSVPGIGQLISSGLTDKRRDVSAEAFLPMRNALFLSLASAYAHQQNASGVAIGLLGEAYSIFPDQTTSFVFDMETLVCRALGRTVKILTPLMHLSKAQVVAIARERGITGTYSCHLGGAAPCGRCIACREFIGTGA